MRICSMLILLAWFVAPGVPQAGGAENEASKLFRAMEEEFTNAKSLECVFTIQLEGRHQQPDGAAHTDFVPYEGSLIVESGNKARLEIKETKDVPPPRLHLVSNGARLSRQDNGMAKPQIIDTPKDLNAEIMFWMARPGLFVPQLPLPDVKAADGRDRFRVSKFELGDKEKVGERNTQRLEYEVAVKGQDIPFSVVVWLDLKTGLPVKRTIASSAPGEKVTVTENYTKILVDGEVDPKQFRLPE